MSYLVGILALTVVLGACAVVVLIALARLVDILPPPGGREEQDESAGALGPVPRGGRLLQ